MKVLATISDVDRLGIVLDIVSGETKTIQVRPEFIDSTIIGRAPCRPFGITWNSDELFIANNKQLLIFNKNLDYRRTSKIDLQINTHQLSHRNEHIWAVSPWTNSLIGVVPNADTTAVEFNLELSVVFPYVRRHGLESDDQFHFNSLLWTDDYLFVAAHAFGENSFINQYDAKKMHLSKVLSDVGSSIHGLALDRGELFWVSTGTNEIRSNTGYRKLLPRLGYARGFAMTSQFFVVATSEFLSRGNRHAGDSWIQVIDRCDGKVVNEFYLPDTGSINDLRLLDEHDYAHGIAPFWNTKESIMGTLPELRDIGLSIGT